MFGGAPYASVPFASGPLFYTVTVSVGNPWYYFAQQSVVGGF
jgi:hypothetical protein